MKNLWNTGWFGLYGKTGLIAQGRAKAMKAQSMEREVALASLYYTARNKHMTALMNPFWWPTLVIPLWHYMMVVTWAAEALVYARAVHNLNMRDGEQWKLSAGGHDVVGTVLLLEDQELGLLHLREASLLALAEKGPLHEWALPTMRLAVCSLAHPVLQERSYDEDVVDAELMATTNIAKSEPQQASRVLALVAEYYARRGRRACAFAAANDGLAVALECGAHTQAIRLAWLRFRIWVHLI